MLNPDQLNIQQANAEQLALIRQLCLQRFDFFCAAVLGYKVTKFHARMIAFRLARKFSMVLAPRGSGKSTILDVAYCIWRILNNPNIRICIASRSGPQAKSFLGEIKQHFENNQDLIRLFGDLIGDTWNEDEITVSTRTKILKEPTITAKSVGAGVPGFHFDEIIADDLCDMENTATELQREKMRHWFYVVLAPTLEPHGQLHIIGTRYHSDDIYGYFAAPKKDNNGKMVVGKWNDKRFGPNTLVIPAVVVNEETGEEESFWPDYFPLEFLQEKRDEGLLFFNLAYQNDASISEGGIISIKDLEMFTWGGWDEIPPLGELAIFQGVDPAISEKETADFFVHVTIGVHNNRDIYVLEIIKKRIPFLEQVQLIIDQWAKWGAAMVAIETVAYQKALVHAIKEKTSWFPVHEVKPRIDKTMRAKILSQYAQRHELHFHTSQYEAMENLAGMPTPSSKHDDLFDGVDLATEAAKQMVLTDTVVLKINTNLRRR